MREEKGTTEDEMVGWHHQLNGHEFEQAPGVDDGQVSLGCCSPWSRKASDMTEHLTLFQYKRSTNVQVSSVTKSCLTFCNPVDRSTPGFPIHHQLPELAQTRVRRVGDATHPSHPLCHQHNKTVSKAGDAQE